MTLQVLTVSTRPGRRGPAVAAWVEGVARAHGGFATVEPVDLGALALPLFDEPEHPRTGRYAGAHTKAWAEAVVRADAFVFVTPEYNFFPPPSLVNALTFLSAEWAYKPVGFVSYGGVSGGLRGVQAAKPLVTALAMMPVPEGVAIPSFAEHFEAGPDGPAGRFAPGERYERSARAMLDALARWAGALAPLRAAP